jgi:hypothetical protein
VPLRGPSTFTRRRFTASSSRRSPYAGFLFRSAAQAVFRQLEATRAGDPNCPEIEDDHKSVTIGRLHCRMGGTLAFLEGFGAAGTALAGTRLSRRLADNAAQTEAAIIALSRGKQDAGRVHVRQAWRPLARWPVCRPAATGIWRVLAAGLARNSPNRRSCSRSSADRWMRHRFRQIRPFSRPPYVSETTRRRLAIDATLSCPRPTADTDSEAREILRPCRR